MANFLSILMLALGLTSACATMIEMKPVEVTAPDGDVSYGAALLAAAQLGYVADSISSDKYLSQSRFAGSRDEVTWQIEITRQGNRVEIRTPSVSGDGKVHRRVQGFLANIQADAMKYLKIRPAKDLATIGKRATDIAKIELRNTSPTGCRSLGFISVSTFNKDPRVANVALRNMFQIETLIRGGNTAVTENVNSVYAPGAIGYNYSLSGTGYDCSLTGGKA